MQRLDEAGKLDIRERKMQRWVHGIKERVTRTEGEEEEEVEKV